ncbi:MAG TPA: lipoyl(octanoyl) transferase LipB [Solirubrobacterales bacterium]|nr:lipoyl(octanoyl) transferase LipB [Solirubrobacterales bacterium]
MSELLVARCGLVPYDGARRAQHALAEARQRDAVGDLLLLLEHPPVYTRGRRATDAELPMGEDWYRAQGIEVTDTDRGGRVTYHGPGQLVAYPIVSLRAAALDVPGYIGLIEEAMIAALGDWGIDAQVIDGLTGVWTEGDPPPGGEARKIASIGIHVSRGVTTHGLAINVNNDLQPFEWIVPCGIEAVRMTSVAGELGAEQDVGSLAIGLADRIGGAYGRRVVEADPAELAARVDGAGALTAAAAASVR